MRIFHPQTLFGANSTHNVSTDCFGLPKVEFSDLVIRDISIFDEVITMAVPFLSIGDFYLIELTVDFKAVVVRIA